MKKHIRTAETHPLTWRLNQSYSNIVWASEYCKKNGYSALHIMLKNMIPKDVVQMITESKLRGRGGAGFYTGIKWSLMPQKKDYQARYLLCNADEMEPGTYKDRLLLEKLPHQLLEGMIIAGFAIEASMGYIFLRGEYIDAAYNLKRAILEARKLGYLGKNILGTNFNFDIVLHTGAGRYICGEETALINSLEGNRPNPRIKPPFPALIGLWGKPTCVNNVETLSNIPSIILNGVSWYKEISLSDDTGTKLMGFSGQVNNPGVWEVPFGISARELLEDYAGGMKKGFVLKAWQPGGASTDFLLPETLDVKMDFSSIANIGSRFGTGVAMVVDHTVSIVSLVLNLEKFFARESCGLCTPCREGLPWIVKILQSFENGSATINDLDILEDLCFQLGPGKTLCAHAPGAIQPLQSAIKLFQLDFKKCIMNINQKMSDTRNKTNSIFELFL
ncbi:NADH-quinone oxidoreductase subunit NuoF [Buchnera aphidicola]|uniref:NADH-quinone oxidoreductase subunit F n=1 Tax=Buchnera aphidicola (Sarucallis kahawaluokalani) TaxID=1241878 RepID=A0A4D6YIU4_9GAMM|nr:NADH-quinone oxidoreductase subunit NuoF [Buchnera aphidicola]QCI25914.1 NADH oxidoreductase (quinone) subunit F [Buchnera aphidicola (Sarucallis kahawaluokalani)]